MNTTSLEPQTNVRTDLWPTMSLTELANQQDLLLTKLALMSSMINGAMATESIRTIYRALHTALDDLNFLLDRAANNKKVR